MENEKNIMEFLQAMKKDWRTRHEYISFNKVVELNIKDDPAVCKKLKTTAHYDPCHIVRREAVRTCNLLNILYRGKPVRLREMRSLDKTLKARHLNIDECVMRIFIQAGVPLLPKRELNKDECYKIDEQLKQSYPRVYDILDGHFAQSNVSENVKVKNKALFTVKSNNRGRLNQFLKAKYMNLPKQAILEMCEKYNVSADEVKGGITQ